MFAFGRFLVTAALWHGARSAPHTEPDCDEPVSATSSALLQSRRQKRDLAEPFGLDLDLGSGSATFNRSGLAAHCRPQALHAQPSAYVANKLEVLKETTMSSKGSCSGISLVNFDTHTSSTTCCPVDSLSCGGCAKYASSKCEQCLGGFLLKDGKCTACISTVGWTNELGDTCDAIPAADCNDRPVNGLSSNQACCQCNGGEKTATPFSYPDTRFAVGAAVSLKPLPRTAERYSVDSGCGFAAHNLTIDGATGAITSTQNPTKPFTVECEVSAHQALHLVSTVKVSVTVEFMSYGAGALFFSSGVTSYPVTLGSAAADWNDFGMVCAPEAPWLSIASSGAVSTSSSTSGGAVTDTETPDGDFVGIDGSVCVVSAKQKSGNETQKRSTTFVALKPKPWPTLSFENSYVDVVIGEELAPMKPKVPSGYEEGTGGLKPSSWYVKCFVDGDWAGTRSAPHWSFDTNWGVGLLGSHSILEVQPDGAISIAPGESMAKLFDEILADNLQRKSILLNCAVWGSFPGSDFPDLRTTMLIRIKDSMCWISETFQGKVIEESTVLTEAVCRNKCRLSKRCSHFTWSQDKCKHYRVENEGGSPVTAYAKVTSCTDLGTCLRLAHPQWVLAGDYCPIGFQAVPPGLEISRKVTQIRAQDSVLMSGQLTTQGDYILQPGPDVCYGADQFTCGVLEFNLKCSKETKLKFKAEMIGPDGGSDSMWVQIKGTGSRLAWHTGQTSDWGWSSADSPEVTAPAGNSVVQFYGREKNFKVRHFKIVHGEADCKFFGPPAKTPTRLVVYKKESSIPQEVMYLTTSAGSSTCGAGKWLVQRASDDDYVDAQLGYFELKGAQQVCIEGRLPSSASDIKLDLATLPCARPLFPEAEEEALQSLVFDDPSTSQPNDFWLHPCDCLPQQWGTEWPADPIALENIPPTSNGSFIPEPFSIVSGQFACPSRQLLKGAKGIHFQSEAESMEPADCEERCKDYKECSFFWAGTSHGATTCRLYEGCDSLVREFGMEGELKAMSRNISCQVASPENCWKTTLRKQFLTQKEGTSPSFTRAAAIVNWGGTRSWTSNSTGSKNPGTTYIEPFGNMSTIKLLGWSYMQHNAGFVRDSPGIATTVVQGLNPSKNYKYSIKHITAVPTHNYKLTVNHGSQVTVSQYSRRRNTYNREGTVAATPRGELVFDFEALNYPLNMHDRTSGTSSSTASENCRRRYRVTSCTCIAESGICSGSKTDGATCWAYGTMDVVGSTGKSITVRAKTRCMELRFASSYSVKTSGGPSFSWLQMGENASLNSVDDEGDREMSLDAVGQAREEEEEEDLDVETDDATEGVDDATEGVDAEETEELKDDDDDTGLKDPKHDESDEDSEDGDVPMDSHNHSMSLLEEGESSASESQGWRRRRRRRRRRRSRRRRSRRRRSRRRRSRRRRTLPSSVSASCDSGQKVLGCNCYMDDFTEKRHTWTVKHHCKEVWRSGETCYAKGGYAQAICAKIPEPAARSWSDISASGSYWSNEDKGPAASCPSGRTLTGCWCKSTTGRGDNCVKVWGDGNTCYARTSGGRASTVQNTIEVMGRCAILTTAATVLSELKIQLQPDTNLLETPVTENRAIGHLAPLSFYYMHLHQQCDSLLLMGGVGVEHCSRPSYRNPNYHPWDKRKVLPKSFVHGSELTVSCWKERFESFRAQVKIPSETLHCVNGDWFNSAQTPELGKFTCEPCVVVAGSGYSKHIKRNEQELYFYSKMAMRVYTELGSVVETSAAAHKFCLKKDKTSSSGMMLQNEQECPEILAIQLAGSSEIQERMMLLLKEGKPDNNQCLEARQASDNVSPAVIHKTCNVDEAQQVISPMALPGILWSMHQTADRQSGEDLHNAYSSYCGAHGALSRLSYGQIFGGELGGTKSLCQFAPVIKFGVFVDSAITYDKTSSNWPDWYTLLADSPILCADGEALTGFKHQPASNKFRYECSRIGGLGAQYEYFSAQVEVKRFDQTRSNWIESLKMINVDCGKNGLLSGFHFEFSEGGRWARSKYTCSKAGGAPVVMEPSTLIEPLIQTTEGLFCPKTLDAHTGRYDYENAVTGDKLVFQRSGSWCVGSDCSSAVGGANPIGVLMTTHEVVNVTDFDGKFEAKGVPGMGGSSAGDLAKKLKALKPPKRPAQPPKPKLQEFKATMPQYSEECLDYQDLWKKVIETHVNEEKEEVIEEAKLEADPGTEGQELLDYHPCAVAAGAGGIFGRMAGQSGQMAPENMLYSDWNDCMQGDINRDLLQAKMDFAATAYDLVANAVQEGVKTLCAAVPGIEIAPLGAGVETEPDDICGQVVDFVRTLVDLPVGFTFAAHDYAMEEEGFNACNPYQLGFSRLFCDIHCVRDAVIRGDRSIINNLEKATKISNDNMKKMVEWSTEANRVETEYLDKKIDHSLKVQSIYLDHISKNTQPPEELLLKDTAAQTKAMFEEMRGYADAASFSTVSRRGAHDALETFLRSAQSLDAQNASERWSQAKRFHGQVQMLHDSLQLSSGGLSRAKVVGRQISHEVQQLQKRMAQQERVLGVYRTHSRLADKAAPTAPTAASRQSLVTLDHLWWRIRDHLDGYLAVAESEVRHIQRSFVALSDYENCQSDSEGLLKSYASSISKMKKGHRKLKSTWREVNNLFGELSAVLRDSDVFGDLIYAEGCESPLAQQTLQQARFVLQSMIFLLHRFQAASLRAPDLEEMKESVSQIRKAYHQAREGCAIHK